ncbi:unnamed protein product [Closterium sp. NIES-54]
MRTTVHFAWSPWLALSTASTAWSTACQHCVEEPRQHCRKATCQQSSGGSGGGGSGGSGGGSGGFGGSGVGSGGSGGSGSSGSGGSRGGACGASGDSVSCPYVIRTGDHAGQTCGKPHTQHCCFSCLDDAWRAEFDDEAERSRWAELLRSGFAIFDLDYDAILAAMYTLSVSAEGDCFLCVPPDPGIEAAALGASESSLPGTVPAKALHTFTLDSGAFRCFFHNTTTLTPLSAPVPVRLANPSGGPVLARSSTVLPCPAVPSGSLSGLHIPSFSTNLVSTTALQVAMVTTTTPGGQRVSLPPLPPLPAPPCLPCVEGQQRAAPHSSSFPPTTTPLQTLHMDVWGPARVSGQGRVRFFLLVVDDYTRYTTVFPLRSKGEDLPVLRLHSDRGGEFSSDLLQDFCRGEGILKSFTLPASPQKNGIAKHRIGLVMEVARTSMIYAATPHFLWPFAPTLRWTGKVGDASVFRVWGSCAFLYDTSADKLSARAILCVFLGFPPDAPGWQFYHPTSRHVLPSQDVMFDESVPFYHLFPYRSAPLPPPPLFLASGPPPVDPLPPQGPAPSGVSQVDPLPGTVPIEVAVDSVHSLGVLSLRVRSLGVLSLRVLLLGGPAGASPQPSPQPKPLSPQQLREWFSQRTRLWSGAAGAGDSAAGDPRARGARATAGAGGTGGAAAAGPGGARTRDPAELGGAGAGGAGAGGAGAGGDGASDTGAVGVGAGGTGAGGDTRAIDPGAGGAGAGSAVLIDTGAGGTVRPRPFFVPPLRQVVSLPSSTSLPPSLLSPPPLQSQPQLQPGSPLFAPSSYAEQPDSFTERCEPESRPALPIRAVLPSRRVSRPRPPPVHGTHVMALRPSSVPLRVPLPAPPESSLPAVPDPESDLARAASPIVSRLLATVVTDPSFESTAASALVAELVEFADASRLDYTTALVAESESASPPSVGDPDAPDIPTPRSYSEAITGPYSSQWQAAMDAEMASWKSTGTNDDAFPPSGAIIVDGMWIFRVKRPSGSPPAFKVRYVARGFSQCQGVDYFQTFSPTPKMTTLQVLLHVAAQRDYELHSLDFSTAFLQGSLHEEIWLRHPHGFTESFPASTQTTLAALGFTPSTADSSLFLRSDMSLLPFYVLVYVDDLVFATTDTEALTLVKSELQKRHTCTDLGELHSYHGLQITRDRARRTITLTQSHMVHQVLQCFYFHFSSPQPTPLSTGHSLSAPPLDESVEPSDPTLGMGLMLGGRGPVVLTGHADASWVDDLATQRSSQGYTFSLGSDSVSWRSTFSSSVFSSSCEVEIYAGAMAAQELRWLTYQLTDLGEQPRSPPVLYVDNKAMIALCQEHRQ